MEPDFLPPLYDDMNQGIAPIYNNNLMGSGAMQGQDGGFQMPDLGTIAKNQVRNQVTQAVASKLGLPEIVGNAMGTNAIFGNPFGLGILNPVGLGIGALAKFNTDAQSSLFGRSKTISSYLQARRDAKIRTAVGKRGLAKQSLNNQIITNNPNINSDGGGIGSSRGGEPSPGSTGAGGSDAMGSS